MTFEDSLRTYFQNRELDLRTAEHRYKNTRMSPRFTDQKVTPDVLSLISLMVVSLPTEMQSSGFTRMDIQEFEKFSKIISIQFQKPSPKEETASNEYDKVISQPLKTLEYAGILNAEKVKRSIQYSIAEEGLLQTLATGQNAAFSFLHIYYEEVLQQSCALHYFEEFKNSAQDPAAFHELKTRFQTFMLLNTRINGETEIRRIFPKVLNVLAVAWQMCGTRKGHVTQHPFTYSDLAYNRENFRDIGKNKSTTRALAERRERAVVDITNFQAEKMMHLIRRRHLDKSEVHDSLAIGPATQVHHIFPRSSFPDLVAVPENMILLTASQHNTRAHPSNKTSIVDPNYQIDCLISKSRSIESSLAAEDGFYSAERLVHVINQGLGTNLPIEMNMPTLRASLEAYRRRL